MPPSEASTSTPTRAMGAVVTQELVGRCVVRLAENPGPHGAYALTAAASAGWSDQREPSSSTNDCVSSHVGSRPAPRTSSSVGAAASRSDRFGAAPSTRGQSMPIAGSVGQIVCSRVGSSPSSRGRRPSNRLVAQGIRARVLRKGRSSGGRGRRAAPSPSARTSAIPPGCRPPRRIRRRGGM